MAESELLRLVIDTAASKASHNTSKSKNGDWLSLSEILETFQSISKEITIDEIIRKRSYYALLHMSSESESHLTWWEKLHHIDRYLPYSESSKPGRHHGNSGINRYMTFMKSKPNPYKSSDAGITFAESVHFPPIEGSSQPSKQISPNSWAEAAEISMLLNDKSTNDWMSSDNREMSLGDLAGQSAHKLIEEAPTTIDKESVTLHENTGTVTVNEFIEGLDPRNHEDLSLPYSPSHILESTMSPAGNLTIDSFKASPRFPFTPEPYDVRRSLNETSQQSSIQPNLLNYHGNAREVKSTVLGASLASSKGGSMSLAQRLLQRKKAAGMLSLSTPTSSSTDRPSMAGSAESRLAMDRRATQSPLDAHSQITSPLPAKAPVNPTASTIRDDHQSFSTAMVAARESSVGGESIAGRSVPGEMFTPVHTGAALGPDAIDTATGPHTPAADLQTRGDPVDSGNILTEIAGQKIFTASPHRAQQSSLARLLRAHQTQKALISSTGDETALDSAAAIDSHTSLKSAVEGGTFSLTPATAAKSEDGGFRSGGSAGGKGGKGSGGGGARGDGDEALGLMSASPTSPLFRAGSMPANTSSRGEMFGGEAAALPPSPWDSLSEGREFRIYEMVADLGEGEPTGDSASAMGVVRLLIMLQCWLMRSWKRLRRMREELDIVSGVIDSDDDSDWDGDISGDEVDGGRSAYRVGSMARTRAESGRYLRLEELRAIELSRAGGDPRSANGLSHHDYMPKKRQRLRSGSMVLYFQLSSLPVIAAHHQVNYDRWLREKAKVVVKNQLMLEIFRAWCGYAGVATHARIHHHKQMLWKGMSALLVYKMKQKYPRFSSPMSPMGKVAVSVGRSTYRGLQSSFSSNRRAESTGTRRNQEWQSRHSRIDRNDSLQSPTAGRTKSQSLSPTRALSLSHLNNDAAGVLSPYSTGRSGGFSSSKLRSRSLSPGPVAQQSYNPQNVSAFWKMPPPGMEPDSSQPDSPSSISTGLADFEKKLKRKQMTSSLTADSSARHTSHFMGGSTLTLGSTGFGGLKGTQLQRTVTCDDIYQLLGHEASFFLSSCFRRLYRRTLLLKRFFKLREARRLQLMSRHWEMVVQGWDVIKSNIASMEPRIQRAAEALMAVRMRGVFSKIRKFGILCRKQQEHEEWLAESLRARPTAMHAIYKIMSPAFIHFFEMMKVIYRENGCTEASKLQGECHVVQFKKRTALQKWWLFYVQRQYQRVPQHKKEQSVGLDGSTAASKNSTFAFYDSIKFSLARSSAYGKKSLVGGAVSMIRSSSGSRSSSLSGGLGIDIGMDSIVGLNGVATPSHNRMEAKRLARRTVMQCAVVRALWKWRGRTLGVRLYFSVGDLRQCLVSRLRNKRYGEEALYPQPQSQPYSQLQSRSHSEMGISSSSSSSNRSGIGRRSFQTEEDQDTRDEMIRQSRKSLAAARKQALHSRLLASCLTLRDDFTKVHSRGSRKLRLAGFAVHFRYRHQQYGPRAQVGGEVDISDGWFVRPTEVSWMGGWLTAQQSVSDRPPTIIKLVRFRVTPKVRSPNSCQDESETVLHMKSLLERDLDHDHHALFQPLVELEADSRSEASVPGISVGKDHEYIALKRNIDRNMERNRANLSGKSRERSGSRHRGFSMRGTSTAAGVGDNDGELTQRWSNSAGPAGERVFPLPSVLEGEGGFLLASAPTMMLALRSWLRWARQHHALRTAHERTKQKVQMQVQHHFWVLWQTTYREVRYRHLKSKRQAFRHLLQVRQWRQARVHNFRHSSQLRLALAWRRFRHSIATSSTARGSLVNHFAQAISCCSRYQDIAQAIVPAHLFQGIAGAVAAAGEGTHTSAASASASSASAISQHSLRRGLVARSGLSTTHRSHSRDREQQGKQRDRQRKGGEEQRGWDWDREREIDSLNRTVPGAPALNPTIDNLYRRIRSFSIECSLEHSTGDSDSRGDYRTSERGGGRSSGGGKGSGSAIPTPVPALYSQTLLLSLHMSTALFRLRALRAALARWQPQAARRRSIRNVMEQHYTRKVHQALRWLRKRKNIRAGTRIVLRKKMDALWIHFKVAFVRSRFRKLRLRHTMHCMKLKYRCGYSFRRFLVTSMARLSTAWKRWNAAVVQAYADERAVIAWYREHRLQNHFRVLSSWARAHRLQARNGKKRGLRALQWHRALRLRQKPRRLFSATRIRKYFRLLYSSSQESHINKRCESMGVKQHRRTLQFIGLMGLYAFAHQYPSRQLAVLQERTSGRVAQSRIASVHCSLLFASFHERLRPRSGLHRSSSINGRRGSSLVLGSGKLGGDIGVGMSSADSWKIFKAGKDFDSFLQMPKLHKGIRQIHKMQAEAHGWAGGEHRRHPGGGSSSRAISPTRVSSPGFGFDLAAASLALFSPHREAAVAWKYVRNSPAAAALHELSAGAVALMGLRRLAIALQWWCTHMTRVRAQQQSLTVTNPRKASLHNHFMVLFRSLQANKVIGGKVRRLLLSRAWSARLAPYITYLRQKRVRRKLTVVAHRYRSEVLLRYAVWLWRQRVAWKRTCSQRARKAKHHRSARQAALALMCLQAHSGVLPAALAVTALAAEKVGLVPQWYAVR